MRKNSLFGRFLAVAMATLMIVTAVPQPLYVHAAVDITSEDVFDDDPERFKAEQQAKYDPSTLIPFSEANAEDISLMYVNTGKYLHGKYATNYDITKGIDVSKHQGTIDWNKVKNDGVEFAIIRVAYRGYGAAGNMAKDAKYIENITGAKNAGIPIGVYIFSQATTVQEAEKEAEFALSCIKGYSIDLPVVMDFEYANVDGGLGGRLYDAQLTRQEATDICNAFCKRVTDAGYEAMVYANRDMLNNHLYADRISNQYKIWIARWNTQTGYQGDYSYWQFSDKGSVSGIKGAVDLDFRYELIQDEPDTDRDVSEVKAYAYDADSQTEMTVSQGMSNLVNPGTTIRLTSDTQNTAIFYTIGTTEADPPVPTRENGIRYTEPIEITSDTVVKAIAMKALYRDSKVAKFSFSVKDTSLNQGDVLDSDLPKGESKEEQISKIGKYFWTSTIEEQTYTGKQIKPEFRVYYGKKLLKEKADYTVSYKNNTNAGTATVVISGKGNYTGSYQTTFQISTRDISDAVSEIAPISVPFTGKKQAPAINLAIDGRKLVLNRDFYLSIVRKSDSESKPDEPVKECKDPGTYILTVSAKENSNYHGSGKVEFTIRAETTSLSTAKIKVTNQNYADWFSVGSSIDDDSDDCLVDPTDSSRVFALTGPEGGIRPSIVVVDKNGNEIPKEEYNISYSNNTGAGTATVTITAKSSSTLYVGKKTQNFQIAGYAISKAGVFYTDPASGLTTDITKGLVLTYDGKPKEPLGSGSFEGDDVPDSISVIYPANAGKEPITLKKGRDFTVSYAGNIKAGNGTVILSGKGRFTGTLRKTFKIKEFVASKDDKLEAHILILMQNPDKEEILIDSLDGEQRLVSEYYYVKGGVTPKVKVYYEPDGIVTSNSTVPSMSAVELVEGVDYLVKHTNNKAVNSFDAKNKNGVSIAPAITITGKNNFKGNVSITYSILKADLGTMSITVADKNCTGKVGDFAVAPVITDSASANKAKLVKGVDYESNPEYRLAEATYVRKYDPVQKKSVKRWVAADTILDPKTDIIEDNTAIKVVVKGKGNYENSISAVYRMNNLDIAKATVKVADQTYFGQAVRPGKKDILSISMKINGRTVLLKPEDYEIVGYRNNTGRGTGILTIHGLGDYCGYKNVSFKINAKSFYYVIEYRANADTCSGTMPVQNVLMKGTKLKKVSYKKPGYEFAGWNTKADGTGENYRDEQELVNIYPGARLTLYAQWKRTLE